MIKNIYSDSIEKVKFSENFDERVVAAMEEAVRNTKKQRARKRFKWQYAALSATACVLIAAAVSVIPLLRNAEPKSAADLQNPSPAVETAPASAAELPPDIAETAEIQTVDATKYASDIADSMAAPQPGDVFLEYGVWQAMDDPATDGKYFFLEIYLFDPIGATDLGLANQYVYNGKTVAEWRELADLANEVYPYEEYNRDHGGKVTKEEYDATVLEAKSLDAIKNCDEAEREYGSKYDAKHADMEKLRLEAMKNECARLKSLGYDAKIFETWTYQGAGEKRKLVTLAGLFTKEQLKSLQTKDANSNIGLLVSWMRNGDGIAEFDKAEWK